MQDHKLINLVCRLVLVEDKIHSFYLSRVRWDWYKMSQVTSFGVFIINLYLSSFVVKWWWCQIPFICTQIIGQSKLIVKCRKNHLQNPYIIQLNIFWNALLGHWFPEVYLNMSRNPSMSITTTCFPTKSEPKINVWLCGYQLLVLRQTLVCRRTMSLNKQILVSSSRHAL